MKELIAILLLALASGCAASNIRYRPCHDLGTDMSVSDAEYYSQVLCVIAAPEAPLGPIERPRPVAPSPIIPRLDCFQALGIKRYTLGDLHNATLEKE